MSFWHYPRYVPVAEKKAKAAGKLAKLRKQNAEIQPIILTGSSIANTWWGKSWNMNLERYADYSNRIGRGRSYVRNGAVLDLRITPGEVQALVQGTARDPYEISVKIKPLSKNHWQSIKTAAAGKLDSLQQLLAGKFPKDLGTIFTEKDKGLFPSPNEITFSCSCPDWASMCKHVAATLYGIGARLDHDPGLFFTLRNVAVADLVSQTIHDQAEELLKPTKRKSERIMETADLSAVFGIDLADTTVEAKEDHAKPEKKPLRAKTQKAPAAQAKRKAQRVAAKAKPAPKSKPVRKPSKAQLMPLDLVAAVIKKSRKGISVAEIQEHTGLDKQQVANLIYRLKAKGLIKNLARGIYVKG